MDQLMPCQVDEESYARLWQEKADRIIASFPIGEGVAVSRVASPSKHYRMRAEFRVWHQDSVWFYTMFDPSNKQKVFIETCPMVTETIAQAMPVLRQALLAEPALCNRLYAVDFLASTLGELLITLIYKIPLIAEWDNLVQGLDLPKHIMILGRSRGKKRVLQRDYVREQLMLPGRAPFVIHHVENAFSQPNAVINQAMLTWVDGQLTRIGRQSAWLELYGGAGNFTWVLSQHADRVLMTELSKQGIAAAKAAFDQAGIEHVQLAAMDSEQVSHALMASGEATRLAWHELTYDFTGILVDPPRAGLDETTTVLVARFEHVIYISCNPETLKRDLDRLLVTHQLVAFTVFDQFPYTHHAEVGVCLRKI